MGSIQAFPAVISEKESFQTTMVSIQAFPAEVAEEENVQTTMGSIQAFPEEFSEKAHVQTTNMKTLAASLRGQTFSLPKLDTLMPNWPSYIGKHHAQLEAIAEIKYKKLGHTGEKLARLRRVNCPLPAACWWPEASLEAGIIHMYWFMFIFEWDDELEGMHMRDVGGNSSQAEIFRKDTLLFIEHYLGLSSTEGEAPLPPSEGVGTFTELGDLLKAQYNLTQRKRWFDEVIYFFNMVKVEQEYIIADQVPSVEDFWTMRMGSGAVGQANALGELCLEVGLPSHIHEHPDMQVLQIEVIKNISAVNDLMSLKKELRDDCVMSLIPVYFYNGMELQTAIDTTWEFLRGSVERFEEAAKRLLTYVGERSLDYERTVVLINAFRTTQTGNLLWSLETDRYGLAKYKIADGSMVVTL
ncbi:hypothetical protein VTL71DRAFT_14004 [Oculimacula yallundae]|uniref:Terpene synthase n=1 Tax=Oculimacula yallundae TaxID=86028 RepID=A0ABR4CM18_9HELO